MLHAILKHLVARGHNAHVMAAVEPNELDGVTMGPAARTHWRDANLVITHLDKTRTAIAMASGYQLPVAHIMHNDRQLHYFRVRGGDATLLVHNSEWIAKAYEASPIPSVVCRPPVRQADYRVRNHGGKCVTLVNLMEAKGATTFYELAKRMPDVLFLGVSGAYGYQMPAPDLPNLEIIEQTPNIRDDVYARTAVLLMPSSYESWGRTAVEAMASGIPVLAHPTTGLLESLGNAGVFIDRDDVSAWEQNVRALLSGNGSYQAARADALRRSMQLDIASDHDLENVELAFRRAAGGKRG